MVYWEPGTQYSLGDVVNFEGHDYKIIQAHRSQSDWTPPVTPALWGRLQGHSSGSYGYGNSDCSSDSKPQQSWQQPQPQPQPRPETHQPPPQYQQSGDNHTQNHEHQPSKPEQHGSGSDQGHGSDTKHWLIGGGIAAGAALLGAGIFAHKHHENSKDEKEWLKQAEANTEKFYDQGPAGPATWVLNRGKSIPEGAVVVGQENTWTLYIARAFYKGSITPGKASDVFKKGAVIGYAHDEVHLDTYEILLGDMRGLKWIKAFGKLNIAALGHRPVDGGVDSDGTALYVARAYHKGANHPGKAGEGLKAAFIPYGGGEVEVAEYEVLCYA